MFALSCFYKIPVWHPQHTKTLTMLFVQVLMVHLVRPTDSTEVHVVGLAQPFEPLMNKNIVHQKIGESVYGNTQPNKEQERQ